MLIFVFDTAEELHKFEFLYERYKRLMLYKAHEILRDWALAEDAVSEAFIRVYKNLHKVDEDPASPRAAAFLMTIVRNVALTLVQREARQHADPLETMEQTMAAPDNLEDLVLADLGEQQLLAIIGRLGEQERDIFVLKYAHGRSHREIGAVLGLEEKHVAVKLHRAKAKLAKTLREEGWA